MYRGQSNAKLSYPLNHAHFQIIGKKKMYKIEMKTG